MERIIGMKIVPQNDEQVRQEVSARYARTALQVLGAPSESASSCCGPSCCSPSEGGESKPAQEVQASSSCCEPTCCTTNASQGSPITSDLYTKWNWARFLLQRPWPPLA